MKIKRIVVAVLAIWLLVGGMMASAEVRGDANCDGKLNVADYVLVKRHVLRTFDLSEKGFKAADVNGDGKINAIDYVLIKRVYMGTAEFPCIHSYTEEIVGNLHVFTCSQCGRQYKEFDGQLIG